MQEKKQAGVEKIKELELKIAELQNGFKLFSMAGFLAGNLTIYSSNFPN